MMLMVHRVYLVVLPIYGNGHVYIKRCMGGSICSGGDFIGTKAWFNAAPVNSLSRKLARCVLHCHRGDSCVSGVP